MKIGVFDSGLGGLTILDAIRAYMPQYDYVYYGDTANLPYGDKTEGEIYTLTQKAIEYLFLHDATIVIVACNTASAETLRRLQETILTGVHAQKKILGVIIPTIEELIAYNPTHTLLIGTKRTVDSGKYHTELHKRAQGIKLTTHATPELVPLIEAGEHDTAYTYVSELITALDDTVDTIILGCTHYTVLKDSIRKNFSKKIISQDEIIPEKLYQYLEKHLEIKNTLTQNGTLTIELSADNARYTEIKNNLLQKKRGGSK